MPESSALLLKLLSEPPDPVVLSDPAAWRLIRENAGPAGMAPLIASIARDHLPQSERLWCDKVLTQSRAGYEQSLHDLNYTLGVLDGEGIRAIALKGALLAQRGYDPPWLRKPSVDLDLAVREEDIERACTAFVRQGYALDGPVRRAKTLSHHAALTHASRRRIELHFRLSHRSSGIGTDEFFDRAKPHEMPGGRVAWVLAPADEMLHLILHAVSDRFATLFHLYEVRRMWRALPPGVREETVRRSVEHHFADALRIVDVALRSLRGEGLLSAGMQLPRTWLHARLNEKLLRAFEDWWGPDPPLPRMDGLWGRWLDFQMTDRPVDAARLAANAARTAWFRLCASAPCGIETPRCETSRCA